MNDINGSQFNFWLPFFAVVAPTNKNINEVDFIGSTTSQPQLQEALGALGLKIPIKLVLKEYHKDSYFLYQAYTTCAQSDYKETNPIFGWWLVGSTLVLESLTYPQSLAGVQYLCPIYLQCQFPYKA